MREVPEKLKEKYEKLRKKYNLPEWKKILLLGFFEDSDLNDIFSLSKAIKKSLLNIQGVFQNLLVPEDFISMQDSRFVRDMRDKLLKALAKIVHLNRKFSLKIFEAIKSERTEEKIAEAIRETVKEVEEILEVYGEAIKKLESSWKGAKIENEEPRYQW